MKKAIAILGLGLALTMLPAAASAQRGGFRGRAYVGVGWHGGYGYGWGPGWYSPYWGSGYYPYEAYYQNSGQVKLDTKVKDAQVFINNAYAGTTHDNKTMHLRPGSYKMEIKEQGQTRFSQNIYVAVGKTLHLHPEL